MRTEWQRPTQQEIDTRGILAWLVWFNSSIPHDVQPIPYTARMLTRRLERGDDMPPFVEIVQRLDSAPEKVAIVGSRKFPNRQQVIDYVASLPQDTVIVSGGAKGVDTWAALAAKECGLDTLIFPAEWDKYGKSAGFRRNADIVNACDRLVAFWDGNSKGTAHSVGLAEKQGKPVEIVKPQAPGLEWFDEDYAA